MPLTAAERTRRYRARLRALGWEEITVRVPGYAVDQVRKFIATLPPPQPWYGSTQLEWLSDTQKPENHF